MWREANLTALQKHVIIVWISTKYLIASEPDTDDMVNMENRKQPLSPTAITDYIKKKLTKVPLW
jgi:hypothetical protein